MRRMELRNPKINHRVSKLTNENTLGGTPYRSTRHINTRAQAVSQRAPSANASFHRERKTAEHPARFCPMDEPNCSHCARDLA